MSKTRIAVLRGGPSDSYELSLRSGGAVLGSLPSSYHAHDILIDRDGVWHDQGIPVSPEALLSRVDVVWNALHGSYGADGTVQNIVRHFGVPFTGPGALSAARSFNTALRADAYRTVGLKTLFRKKIIINKPASELALELFKTFPMPARILLGEAGNATIPTPDFHALENGLREAAEFSGPVFMEEIVAGKHASCAVIDGYRNHRHYALLPLEHGENGHEYPGMLSRDERRALEKAALAVHSGLDMRHYSNTHFLLHPTRGLYALRTESLPPLHEGSPLEVSLREVGSSLPQFVGHVIGLAR